LTLLMRASRVVFVAALAASLMVLSSTAYAQALGPTYPIAEPDLLKEIERVLKEKERNGELAKLQKEALERSKHSAMNPKAVQEVTRTRQARTFFFDPSIVTNQRITTPQGRVLVEAGQRVNPLDQMAMTQQLVFIDARDPAQVAKAQSLIAAANGKAKAVLTGGSYIELQKRWGKAVFFDQQGNLVRKFGIRQVPAIVAQEGRLLRIDEVLP
jgi:conjugal transfer pilus assembly protein TraW